MFKLFFAVHDIFLLLYMNFQLSACVWVEGLTTIIITLYLITLHVLYILKLKHVFSCFLSWLYILILLALSPAPSLRMVQFCENEVLYHLSTGGWLSD